MPSEWRGCIPSAYKSRQILHSVQNDKPDTMAPNPPLKRYQKEFEHSYTFGVYPTLELLDLRPGSVMDVLFHSQG